MNPKESPTSNTSTQMGNQASAFTAEDESLSTTSSSADEQYFEAQSEAVNEKEDAVNQEDRRASFDVDASRAELQRIAQLLNGTEDQYGYLKDVHQADLAHLREKIQSTLQVDQSALWERLAGLAWMHKVVPNFLINKVVKAMGPSICANIVYYVDISSAVSICLCLDPDLIVDCSPFLDPEHPHIQEIIEKFPTSTRIELLQNMIKKKMYFTMARYADHLDEELVEVNMGAVHDPTEYINIIRYCKNRDRVIRLLHKRFSVQDFPDIRSAILAHKTASKELDYVLVELDQRRSPSLQRGRV